MDTCIFAKLTTDVFAIMDPYFVANLTTNVFVLLLAFNKSMYHPKFVCYLGVDLLLMLIS